MKDIQNNFGPLSESYARARRGYPQEVYRYLRSVTGPGALYALDLGCGTGISTRELVEVGFNAIGFDKDEEMLHIARSVSRDIQYHVGEVTNLPFSVGSFDLVTAFTAFHWFNDRESLTQIRRVLRLGGVFFAALKGNQETGEAKSFNDAYRQILRKYAGKGFDSTARHFEHALLGEVFGPVVVATFPYDEVYSIEDSITLLTSLSLWNRVPETQRPAFVEEMREFFESVAFEGNVTRKREICTVYTRTY